MKNRKDLTKSLHTVTAVARVAAHCLASSPLAAYCRGTGNPAEAATRYALGVLGQPQDWPSDDPTFAACVAAVRKAIA